MANYFPVEFLGIFMTFYITYKLKIQNKITSLLFNNQAIYLPFNDEDFKKIMELNKEKKNNKGNNQIMIRTCTFDEYSESSKNKKYVDFEFLIFIYFCNFVIYLFIYIQKIFRLLILGHEKTPFLLEEKNIGDNSNPESSNFQINFSIYLSLSFVIYIIYRELKNYVFSAGFISKAAREFTLCFMACFSIFFVIENYNEKIFNLNYESACSIANNRIDLILTQAKVNYNFEITKFHMKIFFSILFGLISSIFLRCSQRGAYFDNFFCKLSKTTSQLNKTNQMTNISYNSEKSSYNEVYLEYLAKIKSISNVIIIAILLNPMFDNFLEVIYINSGIKKIVIIIILLNIDFILGFFILWYAYFMFGAMNYEDILKFELNPSPQYYNYHKRNVENTNENAWDVLSHVFMNCFMPYYIYFCYLNEINIFFVSRTKESTVDVEFNERFVDNIFFVIFLGMLFSKGIVQNFIFYFRLLTNENHLVLY